MILINFFKLWWKFYSKDLGGNKKYRLSLIIKAIVFIGLSLMCFVKNEHGMTTDFLEFEKDVCAIFVAFFLTALLFCNDLLKDREEKQNGGIVISDEKRIKDVIKYNYAGTLKFSLGINIVLSSVVLLCVFLCYSFNSFKDTDFNEFEFVCELSCQSFSLFCLLTFIAFVRILMYACTLMVLYHTIKATICLTIEIYNRDK